MLAAWGKIRVNNWLCDPGDHIAIMSWSERESPRREFSSWRQKHPQSGSSLWRLKPPNSWAAPTGLRIRRGGSRSMWPRGGTRGFLLGPSWACWHVGFACRIVVGHLGYLWGSRTCVVISTVVENRPLHLYSHLSSLFVFYHCDHHYYRCHHGRPSLSLQLPWYYRHQCYHHHHGCCCHRFWYFHYLCHKCCHRCWHLWYCHYHCLRCRNYYVADSTVATTDVITTVLLP